MRRAGHQRSVSVSAISVGLSVQAEGLVAIADAPASEVPPRVETIARVCSEILEKGEAHHRARETKIKQRIESRLPGRVRNLVVRSFDALVILEGQCGTYYTKQLAQHAAMGVLEDEHLENAIVVHVEQ